MQVRAKAKQHVRHLKSGKVVIVNKGVAKRIHAKSNTRVLPGGEFENVKKKIATKNNPYDGLINPKRVEDGKMNGFTVSEFGDVLNYDYDAKDFYLTTNMRALGKVGGVVREPKSFHVYFKKNSKKKMHGLMTDLKWVDHNKE